MTEQHSSEIALAEAALAARRYADAEPILHRLAAVGYKGAFVKLGLLYEIAGEGDPSALARSRYWFTRAVDEANDAIAAKGLARIHYTGSDGSKDYEKARWYCELIEANAIPDALSMQGHMYLYGLGGAQDLDAAERCYRKVASLGYVFGTRNLAVVQERRGNRWRAVALRTKAVWQALCISIRGGDDMRLRDY